MYAAQNGIVDISGHVNQGQGLEIKMIFFGELRHRVKDSRIILDSEPFSYLCLQYSVW
jgi:hypothetical protein